MIRVYQITSRGKAFLRNKNLSGFDRAELNPCLRMYQKEEMEGSFLFDTHPESLDHPYRAHIKLLEKSNLITRNPEKELELKEENP